MQIWLTRSTKRKHHKRNRLKEALIFSFLVLSLFSGFGQTSDESSSSPSFFTNINGGFGLLYGGFGANLEGGIGHFAGFGALGYAPARVVDTTTIASSVNYHAGIRYYFDVGSNSIFPRVGLGYGWIANYISEGSSPSMDQNVHGLSLHLGTQFYTLEGVVFNFDVTFSSRYVITSMDRHPDFFGLYVRPCIGIGYDLTRLFSGDEDEGKIRNREIDPFGG